MKKYGKGSLLQCHLFGSIADQLINLMCKILSCREIFPRLLRGTCVVSCFPQPTLTVWMDTVNLLLKECQKRIQVLMCAPQRTALALWRQLDLFMWKVGKSAPFLIYNAFIMNSSSFAYFIVIKYNFKFLIHSVLFHRCTNSWEKNYEHSTQK